MAEPQAPGTTPAAPPPAAPPGPGPSAFWPALLLGVALFGAKAAQCSLPEAAWSAVADWLADLAVSSHADLLFAAATGVVFQAVLAALSRWPGARRAAFGLLLAWGAACVVYAVVSIKLFAYLRSPLTYPLLYLAGDLSSMRSSLGAFVDGPFVAGLVLAPAAWLLATWAAVRLVRPWPARRAAIGLALLALALGADAAAARGALSGRWGDRADALLAESPHAAFLLSCAEVLSGRGAESLDVPFTPDDQKDFDLPVARPRPSRRPLPGPPPRNVILLVLETTGTRYLSLYGSKYATTPNLLKESRNALVYDDFYCHVGLTSNSMAAITLSLFPYMTWREYTVEYPRLPGKTLAQVFKEKGLRTAFIHSGDLAYVDQDQFLDRRGFDTIWDQDQIGPAERTSSWGTEDRHLVDGMLRWIDQEKGRPFYLMAWTIQTHHPYDPSPDQPFIDFFGKDLPPDDYDLGRYLNTQHEVDRQLGRLFAGLRQRKLADDTLVVLTGDHGESFGSPHEAWGHGSRIYQEAVGVPLMIWNPRLVRRGRHLKTIGSHVDINPTITDIMGLPADDSWHGRSMFDPGRPPRAYFYAANDDYLLGVREDGFKYIFDVTTGREELYDLTRDPDEQVNVADQHPIKCQQLRRRVAAWRAHESEHLAALREHMPPRPAQTEAEAAAAAPPGPAGPSGQPAAPAPPKPVAATTPPPAARASP